MHKNFIFTSTIKKWVCHSVSYTEIRLNILLLTYKRVMDLKHPKNPPFCIIFLRKIPLIHNGISYNDYFCYSNKRNKKWEYLSNFPPIFHISLN